MRDINWNGSKGNLQTQTRTGHFKTSFALAYFFAIIDRMTGAFKKRLDAYTVVRNLFGFFAWNLWSDASRSAKVPTAWLKHNPEDLEHDLADKLVQFCSFARSSSGYKQGDETISFELRLYRIASAAGVREAFPNISITLRINLSLLATNCSGERSFSVLAWVQNNHRTTMTDQRLSYLSLMAIENVVVRNMDFNDVCHWHICKI